jgi:hypothetical protein
MSDGIHVVPKGDGWAVTRGNYMLDEFKSKQQALQLGKTRARTSKATLHLHERDGSVQMVDNFEGDAVSQRRRKVGKTA